MVIYALIILFGVGCFIIGWGSQQDQIDYLIERCHKLEDMLFGDQNIS